MTIKELKILGGYGKDGQPDLVEEIKLRIGDVISIVGQRVPGNHAHR
jgi:hypothetical protein